MKRDPYKDDQLLELVGDLCNFILDQIVHVKGAYHDRADLGRNPQYQHLRETKNASSRTLITMCMEFVYLMMDCIYSCELDL